MAYDSEIRINTAIRTKEAQVQLSALENRIAKTADKITSLRSKMDALKDAKVPTDEYQNLQRELDAATKEMEKMVAQDSKLADINLKIKELSKSSAEYAEKMKEVRGSTPTAEYESLQHSIGKSKAELEEFIKIQARLAKDGIGKDVDKDVSYLAASENVKKLQYELQEAISLGNKEAYLGIEDRLNRAKSILEELMSKEARPLGDIKYYYVIDKKITDLKNNISGAESELKRLEESGEAFSIDTESPEYQNLAQKYEAVNQKLEKQKGIQREIAQKQADAVQKTIELKSQMQQLVADGKDFTLGQDTEEFAKLSQQLRYAENDMALLCDKHDLLVEKQDKAKDGYKKLGDTAKKSLDKVSKAQKKATGLLGSFGKQLKSILLATFIFNTVRKALSSMIQGIKEGFDNLYEGNERFKNSVNSLKASALTLKNSLAAAFSPLVEIALPYIQRVVEWLTRAVNLMGQFIAALSGRKTYTKAVKQTAAAFEDAAEATEDETDAMNKQLSPLDKLNNLSSEKEKKSDRDKKGGIDPGTMFEEVPIDGRILDFLQKLKEMLKPVLDYAKKLKDVFMQGFWDGLGDWQYRWDSIKDSLKSIKDSLIDIWTDPAVLAAADAWAQSVAYMLGSLVGSVASIGLTIAANLLGGIAKYLEQNKDRIKEYLISMFSIWEEINYMFAELFQSVAYVFEAFASEQGQQLTANITGIFADAFMGITELASKLFRDIANIIIQPFVDNKEAFRTALEGFLDVFAEITGPIKQGIDDTFDKLNEVYDAHFKPFFDSIARGLSELVGKFTEFWNGSVQPILDQWAADFDELWTAHIQPLLDNAAELLGKIADLLKALWENILQPAVAWIIENILPKVLPVIQAIWNMVVNFVSYVADAINGIITILGGIIDFLTGVFTGDWELAFQGLQNIVSGFIDAVVAIVGGFGQLIQDLLNAIWEGVKAIFESFAESARAGIQAFLDWINQNIIAKGNEIKQRFSDFIENIILKFVNGFNTLKGKLKSIIDGIKSIIQRAADWIVEKVDHIVEKISGIGKQAKSMGSSFANAARSPLLSGRSYSAQSVYTVHPAVAALQDIEIPGYATGQVIPRTMKQHLAFLGDNDQETEVVSPLSTMKQAFREEIAKLGLTGGSNGQAIDLNLTVECEGYQLLRILQRLDSEYFKQHGRHAFA